MSIIELIMAGSLDTLLAAILWQLVERRCPFIVIAGPSNAGKSTNVEALLAFLPKDEGIVPIRGMRENFAFLKNSDPGKTCLLCPEISYGLPFYLWGPGVLTLFECLKQGYTLATTMHALSAEEAIGILNEELDVPKELLARLGFVVGLGVQWKGGGIERWVRAVDAITLNSKGNIVEVPVYHHEAPDRPSLHSLDDKEVASVLALKADMETSAFARQVKLREAYLSNLLQRGVKDYAAVREEILAFGNKGDGSL